MRKPIVLGIIDVKSAYLGELFLLSIIPFHLKSF